MALEFSNPNNLTCHARLPEKQASRLRYFLELFEKIPDKLQTQKLKPYQDPVPYTSPTLSLQRLFLDERTPQNLEKLLGGYSPDDPSNGTFSITHALMVLEDYPRTKKLAEAVTIAVKHLADTIPHGPIEVLEVGCGPIPFMSLIAAALEPRVVVTALEVNKGSSTVAGDCVTQLDLHRQIKILNKDGLKYKPRKKKFDLLISETFAAGFASEIGTQLIDHFRPFLKPTGIIIPQELRAYAAIIPNKEYKDLKDYACLPWGYKFKSFEPARFQEIWRAKTTEDLSRPVELGLEVHTKGKDRLVLSSGLTLIDVGGRKVTIEPFESQLTAYEEVCISSLRKLVSKSLTKGGSGNASETKSNIFQLSYKPGALCELQSLLANQRI